MNPKQGTDAALGMAFGHVILKEFHLEKPSAYFTEYVPSTPICQYWLIWK
ncbi:MAG: molybdopterin-dependent oxidoreductase [Porticoccaceae bacterium]